MRGIARIEARVAKQAEPLWGSYVTELLAALGTSAIDRRDGALLSVGYILGLRRSELVGLDLGRRDDGDGFLTIA